MENKKSGKFPPSALIKAVGENLPAHFLFFYYFLFKAEGGNFHKKEERGYAAGVTGTLLR